MDSSFVCFLYTEKNNTKEKRRVYNPYYKNKTKINIKTKEKIRFELLMQ
jgi:hypothetical protein